MTLQIETLSYSADGLDMRSELYVAPSAVGPRPGVLLFPDAFGLGNHVKTQARRLAELGYPVLACDIHGGGEIITDRAVLGPIVQALRADPLHIRARAAAALEALCARAEVDPARIAAGGYCFGGQMALELARSGAQVAATIGFHSNLPTQRPEDAANIKGQVLVCLGSEDPVIPSEDRAAFEAEMRAGGVNWQMHLYGGVFHSFSNPEADKAGFPDVARYDATADRRSWAAMLSLLEETIGAPPNA